MEVFWRASWCVEAEIKCDWPVWDLWVALFTPALVSREPAADKRAACSAEDDKQSPAGSDFNTKHSDNLTLQAHGLSISYDAETPALAILRMLLHMNDILFN